MENLLEKYVLLVEDDPTDFSVFSELLAQLGYKVFRKEHLLPIASYVDAINILKKTSNKIEFAIIDIHLVGEKNGADIAYYIRVNNLPINIIFTTSNFTDTTNNMIATIGNQYGGLIPKPSNKINKEITLFTIKQMLTKVNPFVNYNQNTIWINTIKIDLIADKSKQLFIVDYGKYPLQVLSKDEFCYLCTGEGSLYKVPPNKVLIVCNNLKEGFLVNKSMENLLQNHLDDRFVRVNANTVINLMNCKLKSPSRLNSHIVSGGVEIEISKKYRSSFEGKLKMYKLVP